MELYARSELVQLARRVLGEIDLDPATDEIGQRTVGATRTFTAADDGLTRPWDGRVWLFPPVSYPMSVWSGKLLHEWHLGRTRAALLYGRFDARWSWFQHLAAEAVICFPGQICAVTEKGAAAPKLRDAALLAYLGPDPERFARECAGHGVVLRSGMGW